MNYFSSYVQPLLIIFILFIPVFVLSSCDDDNERNPVVLRIDPDDDSCEPLTDEYETCAEACENEPFNCANDIQLHIESEGFISRREINPTIDKQTGEVLEGQVQKPNIQSPMHGLFVPVWNNPQLNNAIRNALENPFDTFIAPPWSISAKLNNAVFPENSNPRDLNWSTVMYKIPGYCPERIFPDDPDAPCLGGEWFWYLDRGGLLSFDWEADDNSSVAAFGKAEDFCVDCHGAVADTDWLWITHDLIRREQELQEIPIIDNHMPASEGAAFCENITSLSPDRPTDVLFDPSSLTDEQANRMFNCYSWKTFIALFWPASETQRGVPDTTKSIADAGQRVWGTYKQTYELFQPMDPGWTLVDKNWNDDQPLPDVCMDALIANNLPTDTKTFQILNETHQAFGSQFNNLIDQNNNEVHYNVRVNRDEFERMKEMGFADTGTYDYNGPLSVENKVRFQMPDNTDGFTGEGATELKSAWKIMCTDPETCNNVDDPSRYYTETVLIYTPPTPKTIDALNPDIIPQNNIIVPATCEVTEAGLVGFHIAVKTFWAPQWIWPTFEHIDNVPGNTAEDEPEPLAFSFFDPECAEVSLQDCVMQRPGILPFDEMDMPELRCCPNQMIIVNSSPDPTNMDSDLSIQGLFPAKNVPIQVNRLDPIGDNSPDQVSVLEFNNLFRGLLEDEGSPLQNYILVNTQWPGNGRTSATTDPPYQIINKLCLEGDNPNTCFEFLPKSLRLRNSVIETYDMAYCEPTDEDIGNDGGPDCNAENVAENPVQHGSGGCMNCHYSAGTDSSFIWADGIEEQIPLEN